MAARPTLPQFAIAASVSLLAFAFVAAPFSCEWGLTAYAVAGIGATVAAVVAPFVLARSLTPEARLARAGVALLLMPTVWCVGLFVANVRIMCRLF